MNKLEPNELPPATTEQLVKGAFLFHLDHCVACSKKSDVLMIMAGDVVRMMKYVGCPIGNFLMDLWKETQK